MGDGKFFTRIDLKAPTTGRVKPRTTGRDEAYYNERGCDACPLVDTCGGIEDSQVKPSGTSRPLIYVLGEAPGKDEAEAGEPFVGKAGQELRRHLPDISICRFNNPVRARPENNRVPTMSEVESCRQHLVADIERTKPAAILACGATALSWFIGGEPRITTWRGRRLPVQVGSHRCWMYPVMHPSFIIRQGGDKGGPDREARQHAVMFKHDIKRCFAETKKGIDLGDLPWNIDALEDGVELATPKLGVKWVVKMLEDAAKAKICGLDLETNRVRPYASGSRILSMAISTPKTAFAFPIGHSDAWWSAEDEIVLTSAIRGFLLTKMMKVVHNASFDMEWLLRFYGVQILKDDLWNTWGCTQNQAYTLDERKEDRMQSLDSLCLERLGTRLKKYSDVDAKRGEVAEIGKLLRYNALDAKCHRLLYEEQNRALKATGMLNTYLDHVRRVPFLVLMQHKGVPVSQPVVEELLTDTNTKIRLVTQSALDTPEAHQYRNTWGTPFIINGKGSRECLEKVFGHIEALYRKDANGEEVFTTDSSVFSTIDSPLAHSISEFREWTKIRDTYLLPMRAGAGSLVYEDGNLHANFNGTFTDTGRLSSDGPNMQNFPKREHAEVRKMVSAPEGWLIVSADMKQLEVCVAAQMSGDKRLLKAVRERADIHMKYAIMLSEGVPLYLELVGHGDIKKARSAIKSLITFPFLYGAIHTTASRNVLASMSQFDRDRAESVRKKVERTCEDIEKEFWIEYRDVKAWQNKLMSDYEKNGYVTCMNGRRRRGPLSINQIANTPIQGSASDLVVDAGNRLAQKGLRDNNMALVMNMNIHDDLTTFAKKEAADDVMAEMVETMLHPGYENWDIKACPLGVEVSIGSNWSNQKAIGTWYSDEA